MKVLLVNPKFPWSFWSLSETCQMNDRKVLVPPLGLLTVAALLPQDWEFRLADLNTRPLAATDWQWADLVMITGMLIQRDGILSLVREAKRRGKTCVVGGPFATSLSHEVLEAGADFLVRGEGETTIPSLVAALREGQTSGVIAEDHKPEMTASPQPRFDLLRLDDYATLVVQTSRGCPFDCEFCDIVSLYGRKPRYKDPDQVIAELETLYRLGWRREVFFSDDNFIGNKDHARAILNRLIPWMKDHGEPFSFWTRTSVNLGQDRELIDLMTAANFAYVFLGVETPETDILRATGKHQNVSNPLASSLTAINANGLSLIASFIIGFDGEKQGAGDRITEFAENLGIPVVMLNILQPLPNTRLWKRLEKEGRLLHDQSSGDFYGMGFNYLPSRPREEILAEYVRSVDRLYEPSRYMARVYRYYLQMRPTRAALAQQGGGKPVATSPFPKRPAPSGPLLKDLSLLLRFVWKIWIKPGYRRQFWRQLLGIYRQNPSRLKGYIVSCGMGLNLFAFRSIILEKWKHLE